jgi:DNA-binding NarL/FixJ family response regulator
MESMIKVLVVDDHIVVRSGIEQVLSTTDDIEIVGLAPDGEKAVEMVRTLQPHVVLMDLSMPVMDGVEATRRIRQVAPDTKVVVLTSFSDQARIMDAMAAGAEGYLLKHADPSQITEAIHSVVEGGVPLDPKAARVMLNSQREMRPTDPLSSREREVLVLLCKGMANKQIARHLGISERTVKAHLTHVFQRLGVSDRTGAALWAKRNLAEVD